MLAFLYLTKIWIQPYIDNVQFDQIADRIYTLLNFNSSDTKAAAPFLDLNYPYLNGTVSAKIYEKWDYFDFDIINFQFLDGDVPHQRCQ